MLSTIGKFTSPRCQKPTPSFSVELWTEIFQHLDSSSDLFHIIQCSREFYALGILVLYRNIHYEGPLELEQNASFWVDRMDSLSTKTRSLSFGIGFSVDITDPLEEFLADLVMREQPQTHPLPLSATVNSFYQKPQLKEKLFAFIESFRNLHKLSFDGMALPASIWETLQRLPNLRHLSLDNCILARPMDKDIHLKRPVEGPWGEDKEEEELVGLDDEQEYAQWNFTLPITSLSIIGITWHRGIEALMGPNTFGLVATAQSQLRTLRMEWTISLAFTAILVVVKRHLPFTIEFLELDSCPESLLESLLVVLAVSGAQLKTLTISPLPAEDVEFVPKINQEIPDVLLPALKEFEGPAYFLPVLRGNRVLERLTINSPHSVEEMTQILNWYVDEVCGPPSDSLRQLSIIVSSWHVELMYCIVGLFPYISSLSILYQKGPPPDMDMLTMLGGQFLEKLSRLEALEVLDARKTGMAMILALIASAHAEREDSEDTEDESESSDTSPHGTDSEHLEMEQVLYGENDVQEVLAAWNTYTPRLKAVRLINKVVWKREKVPPTGGGKGGWGQWYTCCETAA